MEDVFRHGDKSGFTITQNWAWHTVHKTAETWHWLSNISQKSCQTPSILQEEKCCHSVVPVSPESELNSHTSPLSSSVTMVAFLSAFYFVIKLETEGIVDNELSCLLSHNNGVQESRQRYRWLHKQRQEEECWSINKHRMSLKNRTVNMPRKHRDGKIAERALFLWRCIWTQSWAFHQ